MSGNAIVWDLYCGIGSISLFLAKKAKKVLGVEIVPEAIEDARLNAKINKIDNFEDVLLIPLGRAVEEVLCKLKDENLIKENQILMGFPHPSGANVNRLVQLEQNKEEMINFLKKRTVS